jgi:hypothetical protein
VKRTQSHDGVVVVVVVVGLAFVAVSVVVADAWRSLKE